MLCRIGDADIRSLTTLRVGGRRDSSHIQALTFTRSANIVSGAPADAVVYDADPRTDLTQLDARSAVILRGCLVHRRTAG
jgi:hypothetical protein